MLCLPHNALAAGEPIALQPDPEAAVNILMLHGTVAGGAAEEKLRYVSEYGGVKVETGEIQPDRWDYVALGHYHIATELAPNMWYAGGIERTSTNIWEEADGAKGFLTYDTGSGKATFHPLPSRPVVDLPRFSALRARVEVEPRESDTGPEPAIRGPASQPGSDSDPRRGSGSARGSDLVFDPDSESDTEAGPDPDADPKPGPDSGSESDSGGGKYLEPTEIDAKIRALVEGIPGGLEGKIVRLVIADVPRELFRELDHRQIREYKAEALHFHLDARRPEVRRIVGMAAPGRRRTLEEEVRSFLTRHWQRSSRELEVERLVALAERYLAEAGAGEAEDALVTSESVGE